MKYRYELGGIDGSGREFNVDGELETSEALPAAISMAQRAAYEKLTGGKTEFGKPGEGGCRGPYQFRRLLVERTKG